MVFEAVATIFLCRDFVSRVLNHFTPNEWYTFGLVYLSGESVRVGASKTKVRQCGARGSRAGGRRQNPAHMSKAHPVLGHRSHSAVDMSTSTTGPPHL
jgi:hypothetical protein